MIVALRITTGGFGRRRYVEGYCGRSQLFVVSWPVAAAGAAGGDAGAGFWELRAPAEEHAAAASTISPSDEAERSRMRILLLHELEHERRACRRHPEQTARRVRAHVHHHGELHAADLQAISLEGAGRNGHALAARHLHRHDL